MGFILKGRVNKKHTKIFVTVFQWQIKKVPANTKPFDSDLSSNSFTILILGGLISAVSRPRYVQN